jgi:hypothetical protein
MLDDRLSHPFYLSFAHHAIAIYPLCQVHLKNVHYDTELNNRRNVKNTYIDGTHCVHASRAAGKTGADRSKWTICGNCWSRIFAPAAKVPSCVFLVFFTFKIDLTFDVHVVHYKQKTLIKII